MRFRRTCVVLFALSLSGCGVTHPRYSLESPNRISTTHRESNVADNISAPAPGEPQEVSLHRILAFADQHSPLLAVSRAELLRGDAEVVAATPLFPSDPTTKFSAGPRIGSDGTGLDLSLGLQQELEISGARALRQERAKRFQDVKSMELEEVRWLVHQRVHALFHQALVARDQTFAADKLLVSAEFLLSIAERRLKAGDISPLGVRVAQGELAQARQAKVAAEGAYRSVQITLAEVAGWPANQFPIPAGNLDAPRKAPDQQVLLTLAEENNTQLQTRVAQTRLAEANHHLADRESWPKPSIGVQYARESETASGIGGVAEADILLVGVSLPLPIWRRNITARSKAKAEVSVAQAVHGSESQRLRARVLRAANQVNIGADRIAAYGSEILPTFEKNLTMLQRAFELGEIEVLDVSVAQRRFLEIQQSALAAYQEYYQAVAALEGVVGAEVWPEERHDTGDFK